jgi:hypothetical protein
VIPFELPLRNVDDAMRVVRALGTHRYVAGKLHLVHAFVYEALDAAGLAVAPALTEGAAWAKALLGERGLDLASRDERLWRCANEEEIALALEGFWRPGVPADRAQERLMERLRGCELDVPTHAPFDERFEDETHPVLIDAGWELLRLAELDPERHKGARSAFGEAFDFDVARFEEESRLEPPTYLQELPAFGTAELLRGTDADGMLIEPLVLWTEGPEPYHDYVVRGVRRAAKI